MTKPDKRTILLAAARLALVVAAWLQAAATREESRRREEARRIAADGEAALAEHINGWPALAHAEEEAILSGRDLPPHCCGSAPCTTGCATRPGRPRLAMNSAPVCGRLSACLPGFLS